MGRIGKTKLATHSVHKGNRLNYDDLKMNVEIRIDSIRSVFYHHGLTLNEYFEIDIVDKISKKTKQKNKFLILKTKGTYKNNRFGVHISYHGFTEDEIIIWVKITNSSNVFIYNYNKKLAYSSMGFIMNMFRMDDLRSYLDKWLK